MQWKELRKRRNRIIKNTFRSGCNCNGIIIKHEGDISIESQLDKGTTVIIKIPAKDISEMN